MKKFMKFITSFVLSFLMIFAQAGNVFAANWDFNEAYNQVKEYYKGKAITSLDSIMAIEALGDEAEEYSLDEEFEESLGDLDTTRLGDLSKGIISLSLLGKNPFNYNGHNYVKDLETLIGDDGAINTKYGVAAPNYAAYVLYVLYVVDSPKVDLVASYYSKCALDSGAYWYEYGGTKYEDEATTAWMLEALTLINRNKYSDAIDAAFDYLETSTKHDDGLYYLYSSSVETQGTIIGVYATYKRSALSQKSLDQVANWQFEDGDDKGGFYYLDYMTNNPVGNDLSTAEAAMGIGEYVHGSVFTKARNELQKTLENTYKVVEGNNQKVVIGNELTFKSNADFDKFKEVKVDGNVIDAKNYTVSKGSTVVTLNKDYTSGLTVGKHSIVIVSVDGAATATFEIENAPVKNDGVQKEDDNSSEIGNNTSTTANKSNKNSSVESEKTSIDTSKKTKVVKTDDETDVLNYALLLLGSAVMILVLRKYGKVNFKN